MNITKPKRNRAVNWDDEEKQLFRSVLKDYVHIIEDKSLDTNTIKIKTQAWEEIHKRFNILNRRPRDLSQLKIQWKTMKVYARKSYSTFDNETINTGCGERPETPDDSVQAEKDSLNPAELLEDHSSYDSDEPETKPVISEFRYPATEAATLNNVSQENRQDTRENIEQVYIQVDPNPQPYNPQICTPFNNSEVHTTAASADNPVKTNMSKITEKVYKRKIINKSTPYCIPKFRKNYDYVNTMLRHSKYLKEEEHKRRMEMVEEEHAIKIQIQQEKLKSAILEREMLELMKAREEKL